MMAWPAKFNRNLNNATSSCGSNPLGIESKTIFTIRVNCDSGLLELDLTASEGAQRNWKDLIFNDFVLIRLPWTPYYCSSTSSLSAQLRHLSVANNKAGYLLQVVRSFLWDRQINAMVRRRFRQQKHIIIFSQEDVNIWAFHKLEEKK